MVLMAAQLPDSTINKLCALHIKYEPTIITKTYSGRAYRSHNNDSYPGHSPGMGYLALYIIITALHRALDESEH